MTDVQKRIRQRPGRRLRRAKTQREFKKVKKEIKVLRRMSRRKPVRRVRRRPRRVNRGTFSTVITSFRGFGAYKVNGNSLLAGGMDPPMMINSINNGGFIVRHREFLQDIAATIDFNITSFNINAGLEETFPWLSNLAQNFEQYKVRGMVFEFKSLSSDAILSTATSSALGSVIMATQYDVLDPIFPSKFEMANYEFANSSKPSVSFFHPVECAKAQTTITELYVRSESIPSGADARFYDLGRFSVATVGMQADSGLAGELWVTYEVELFKPKINSQDAGRSAHVHGNGGTGTIMFGNATADESNSLMVSTLFNDLTIIGDHVVGDTIIIQYSCEGPAPVVVSVPAIAVIGGNFLLAYDNNTAIFSQTPTGTTTNYYSLTFYMTVTEANALITFGATGPPILIPNIINWDLFVHTVSAAAPPVIPSSRIHKYDMSRCVLNKYDTYDEETIRRMVHMGVITPEVADTLVAFQRKYQELEMRTNRKEDKETRKETRKKYG